MTRHTRSKQLIKLVMMQGGDVKFEKWNYAPGYNLPIEESIRRQEVTDQTFKYSRIYKRKNKRKSLFKDTFVTFQKKFKMKVPDLEGGNIESFTEMRGSFPVIRAIKTYK